VDLEFYEWIHQRGRLYFEGFSYENPPHGEAAAGPSSRQPARGLTDSVLTSLGAHTLVVGESLGGWFADQ
jgi:hypothetical protein